MSDLREELEDDEVDGMDCARKDVVILGSLARMRGDKASVYARKDGIG